MAEYKDGKLLLLGNTYIKNPERQSKRYPSMLTSAMMMMLTPIMDSMGPFYKKPRQRPRVDIVKEYELIRQKKSRLSRNDRDWVEIQFNKNFIKI